MTTLGDRLHRHYHLKVTGREGQTHHLRMVPLGVSRKTCTEGTDGWTVGSTILNGKLLETLMPFFPPGADNSVSIAL